MAPIPIEVSSDEFFMIAPIEATNDITFGSSDIVFDSVPNDPIASDVAFDMVPINVAHSDLQPIGNASDANIHTHDDAHGHGHTHDDVSDLELDESEEEETPTISLVPVRRYFILNDGYMIRR